MNHRAWDIMIWAEGIYSLHPKEIARVIELEEKGFNIHYATQNEFEYVEEMLHPVMRFVDRELLNEEGHPNLYIPKPRMKDRLQKHFGIEGFQAQYVSLVKRG